MKPAHDLVRAVIDHATLAALIEAARPDAATVARALWALPQGEAEQFARTLLARAAAWRDGTAAPAFVRLVVDPDE